MTKLDFFLVAVIHDTVIPVTIINPDDPIKFKGICLKVLNPYTLSAKVNDFINCLLHEA